MPPYITKHFTKSLTIILQLTRTPQGTRWKRHTAGNKFTDIVVTCTLDYGEPTGQAAFDNTTDFNGDFVFDELGLKSFEGTENGSTNKLLTHVIFHPVQKSLNRLIQIDYTLRIQSLTTFTETSSTALSTSNTVSGTTSGGNTGY